MLGRGSKVDRHGLATWVRNGRACHRVWQGLSLKKGGEWALMGTKVAPRLNIPILISQTRMIC